jgi:hypothetical protein
MMSCEREKWYPFIKERSEIMNPIKNIMKKRGCQKQSDELFSREDIALILEIPVSSVSIIANDNGIAPIKTILKMDNIIPGLSQTYFDYLKERNQK